MTFHLSAGEITGTLLGAALWARRYTTRQCVVTLSDVGQRPVAESDMDAMDEVSEWAVANARELAALDAKAGDRRE